MEWGFNDDTALFSITVVDKGVFAEKMAHSDIFSDQCVKLSGPFITVEHVMKHTVTDKNVRIRVRLKRSDVKGIPDVLELF